VTLKHKLFSFEGRLRRRDYWMLTIPLWVLQFAVSQAAIVAVFGVQATVFQHRSHLGQPWSWPGALNALVSLIFAWPGLALMTKRRHDRDASVKPFLVLNLICVGLAGLPLDSLIVHLGVRAWAEWLAWLLGTGIMLYIIIVLGFLEGDARRNRYGPSPKAGGDELAVFD
jgi:uncharacterized membrane protein YhaH (DUF805 family)